MRLVLVCVGFLVLPCASSYAQNSAAETSKSNAAPATISNSNSSLGAVPAATQAQDQTAEPSSSKDADKEPSEHHTHVRLGGIAVSAGYSHFSPGFYPNIFPYDSFYYPFTAAMWGDPFWGFYSSFPNDYFRQGNDKGELKLRSAPKNASVYLNGGYAGTADHLKSFWLNPGAYDLEVSVPDGHRYQQRVYVLTGKTLHIDAKPMLMTQEGDHL
jgi:hypothetical protein